MSLSIATLSSLQNAGAAVFAADIELKNAVKDYAERVNAAIVDNPNGLGNDTLFENWKVVARLSQSMVVIEEELNKLYRIAAELNDQPLVVQVPAPAAQTSSVESDTGRENGMQANDARAKIRKKSSRPAPPGTRPPRASAANLSPSRRAGASANAMEISGNAAKLLRHFEKILNLDEFTLISQTAIGREIGIPMGSMTAATKKLIESGRLMAGPAGSFKLVKHE